MKIIRFLGFLLFLIPCVAFGANNSDFQTASKLLSAARRGDIQTVQILINNGADIDYVDATGLSLVCTAVMNNDTRAIQILQMYGADSSNCDRQIKVYKQKSRVAAQGEEYGFFSGLSSTHILALSAVGVAAVVGGVVLLSKAFDNNNNNGGSGANGNRPNNNNSDGTTSNTVKLFALNLPYGPACSGTTCPTDFSVWEASKDFAYMSDATAQNTFNYLMVAHAYDAFVRGYLGMSTIRINSDKSPFDLSQLPYVEDPSNSESKIPVGGGAPINVVMVTESGVNASGSAVDGIFPWIDAGKIASVQATCQANGANSEACQTALAEATTNAHKYYNYNSGASAATGEDTSFNLSGAAGSVFGSSASDSDTKLAKIIAGWEHGGRSTGDFYGFIPNGQLSVYKIGTGSADVSDYKNYAAIYDAIMLQSSGEYLTSVVANLSLPSESSSLLYADVNDAAVLNVLSATPAAQKATYAGLIDKYYNLNTSDDTSSYTGASGISLSGTQSDNAALAFKYLAGNQKQILVNPAGHTIFGNNGTYSAHAATFENFAPAVYNDLQNLFMTVVAVKPANGTKGTSIDNYTASGVGKLELAVWTDSSNAYQSRICGLTGTGNGGAINPWCFAAPGTTDLEATASMAGSIALVKSAFDYMTPNQIFLLLALTADGPYLGTNPSTNLAWSSTSDLISYLQDMYTLPGNLDSSSAQYLESFKQAFGYGMINLERATRPSTNVFFYSSDTNSITSSSGNAYWRNATTSTSSSRASTVMSLTNRAAIKTSFYDVIESADGSISLPRVWNATLSGDSNSKHGLYMGDVLGDFNVDSTNKRQNKIGNFSFDMSMSPRAYNDNMNGLDNLRVAFNNEKYDIDAEYQHHLTDGESRFNGRANGLLGLVSNSVSSGAKVKFGNFAFGTRAFSGSITNENLLETDPVVSSQFEPGRLGFASGASIDSGYSNDKFGLDISFGNMHESNTVLGMANDGLLTLGGGETRYVDTVATYKLFDNTKLSMRAMFADTRADVMGGIISELSSIKSDAYAIGLDIGNFSFTVSMPLAVVDGKMGYDYADFNVVENDGKYMIELVDPHIEYIDLASNTREKRFAGSYKQSLGEFTDAGVGFIYRVNPNNTNAFGNESILMFKLHHRLGV